ncbi:hypothetical protein [Pleionea sp. CnH1-48]|uniref:hypothetical protein n=1 Tax=Pleionea sp. CnH1-48 TaxID=2954494 RepID=UPI002097E962|nr:hypothetical protein [Pleionea sp. CnH1-48]MCO7226253.1 hypothetical protein [Pleionea sp. CnH1-48]
MNRTRHRLYCTAFILSCLHQTSIAEDYFTPAITVSRVHTDNLLLDEENPISAIVDVTEVQLDWNKQAPNWSSRLDFNIENINYRNYPVEDEQYEQYNFSSSIHSKAKAAEFGFRSTRDQVYSSFLRPKALSNINISENRADFQSDTAFLNLDKKFGALLAVNLNLSFSKIDYDHQIQTLSSETAFNDSDVGSAQLRLSNGSTRRNQWYISSSVTETKQKYTDQEDKRYESHDASFYVPISRGWDFVARGGHINDDISAVDEERNGTYYSSGIRFTGRSKFSFEAVYGDRFSEASLRYFVQKRSSITATYTKSDLGQLQGSQFDIEWRTLGKRSEFRLLKRRNLENQSSESILQLPLQNNLIGTGLPDPDDFIPIVSDRLTFTDFILERSEAYWSYQTNRFQFGVELQKGERIPVGEDFVYQNLSGGKVTIAYLAGRRSIYQMQVLAENTEFPFTSQDSKLDQILFSWRYTPGIKTSVELEASRLNQTVSLNDLQFDETRVELSFNRTF